LIVNLLQSIQIFDTVVLPWYRPKVFDVRTKPDSGKSGPLDPLVGRRQRRSSGACAPDRRPRL